MGNTRKLKVYNRMLDSGNVPQIMLQGKWLEQYGFTGDSYISVECEEGKLVITPREPDPEETQKRLEERIGSMTKSQRKKLAQVLDDMGVE